VKRKEGGEKHPSRAMAQGRKEAEKKREERVAEHKVWSPAKSRRAKKEKCGGGKTGAQTTYESGERGDGPGSKFPVRGWESSGAEKMESLPAL